MNIKLPIFSLIVFTLAMNAYGQNNLQVKFNYTQVDSLINDAIKERVETSDILIVSEEVDIGSYLTYNDGRNVLANPFSVYIFFNDSSSYYVQQIDNFGYINSIELDISEIEKFITSHLSEMQKEVLSDTIYKNDAIQKPQNNGISFSLIPRKKERIVNHYFSNKVKIYHRNDTLEYEYPSYYNSNSKNFKTYKYLLIKKLALVQKKVNEKYRSLDN